MSYFLLMLSPSLIYFIQQRIDEMAEIVRELCGEASFKGYEVFSKITSLEKNAPSEVLASNLRAINAHSTIRSVPSEQNTTLPSHAVIEVSVVKL